MRRGHQKEEMFMSRELMHRFSALAKTDLVYEADSGDLTAYFDNTADSPLMHDPALRRQLRDGVAANGVFFLLQADFNAYYFALTFRGGRLYTGPMCNSRLSPLQCAQFYRHHNIEAGSDVSGEGKFRALRVFTLRQIKDISVLAVSLFCGIDIKEEELFTTALSDIGTEYDIQKEQQLSLSTNEAYSDEGLYRHTYYEEEQMIRAVQEGRAEEAVRISEGMDSDTGRFSPQDDRHWQLLATINITLIARAAITGGILPEDAYRISGYYIIKCAAANERRAILYYRNRCIEDFCRQIDALRRKQKGSGYTVKCRDYIHKHFREKIYIENIAEPLGISAGYLSRLFKKETGMLIQDYVNQVRVERAANLLIYSDSSLPEIASYVHFPTQSYFGKIFKQFMGTTPNEYRKLHRVNEFWMDSPPR